MFYAIGYLRAQTKSTSLVFQVHWSSLRLWPRMYANSPIVLTKKTAGVLALISIYVDDIFFTRRHDIGILASKTYL